jgi:hypothetical protein
MQESKLSRRVSTRLGHQVHGNISTTVLGVIRMVKLFGWEQKMTQRLSEKREEELIWIKRRQLLQISNAVIK